MARSDLLRATRPSAKKHPPTHRPEARDSSTTLEKSTEVFPPAKIKAHSLTGRITQPLLLAAFKAVKANRGAAGIDKVSVQMFESNLAENLSALERDLKDGSFSPL